MAVISFRFRVSIRSEKYSNHSAVHLHRSEFETTLNPRKTLVFYRDRPVGGVAWAWLCGAVTIEPFEVSLWGGGCGGLLWDFNHAGSLVQSRRGRLRASAATLRCGWDCERSVRCGA